MYVQKTMQNGSIIHRGREGGKGVYDNRKIE